MGEKYKKGEVERLLGGELRGIARSEKKKKIDQMR